MPLSSCPCYPCYPAYFPFFVPRVLLPCPSYPRSCGPFLIVLFLLSCVCFPVLVVLSYCLSFCPLLTDLLLLSCPRCPVQPCCLSSCLAWLELSCPEDCPDHLPRYISPYCYQAGYVGQGGGGTRNWCMGRCNRQSATAPFILLYIFMHHTFILGIYAPWWRRIFLYCTVRRKLIHDIWGAFFSINVTF